MEDDGDQPMQLTSDDEEEDINPLQHLENFFHEKDLIQERKKKRDSRNRVSDLLDDSSFLIMDQLITIDKSVISYKCIRQRKKNRDSRNRAKLNFYRECHRFKEPLSVLVDDSFLSLVLAKNSDDIDLAKCLIGRFLMAEFKLFATSCTVGRCSALGDCALLVEVIDCYHEKPTSSDECLKEKLENNAAGILATCDMKVLNDFEGTLALPIVLAEQKSWKLMGAYEEERDDQYMMRYIVTGEDISGQIEAISERIKRMREWKNKKTQEELAMDK